MRDNKVKKKAITLTMTAGEEGDKIKEKMYKHRQGCSFEKKMVGYLVESVCT